MERGTFIIIPFCATLYWGNAQDSFYSDIQLGTYAVGYFDTVIYNEAAKYEQYGYQGAAPIFVQIWHPLEAQRQKRNYLTYKDFRQRHVPADLEHVSHQLNKRMDESFIAYNIAETFGTFDPIDYGNYSYEQVLQEVSGCTTRSTYAPLNRENEYPVIVYHHGSQGLADENFILAEYFASRGYIVVSANYHLPFEGLDYGLPIEWLKELDDPKIVSEFASTLTNNATRFYVGHSWGAQIGFRYLHEQGWADGFVSMETTVESKTDSTEIKDKWAEMWKVIQVQKKSYSMPILLFGRNGERQPFFFFEELQKDNTVVFASTLAEFGHESYTSAYLLRYYYREKYKQPDEPEMEQQVDLYGRHLELIYRFFESIRKKQAFITKDFEPFFYFQ